jgi:ribose transport system ATP-binding protein
MTEISVANVYKYFGETKALDDCNFRAKQGEIHAIVGENGSGKSTLVKIMSGVIRPDSGEVLLFGSTPTTPIEAKRLGITTIFQEVLVADEASVTDNLFVGRGSLWRKEFSQQKKRTAACELIQRFTGKAINPDTVVGQLPLNVRQWIVIGRALLCKPRVLIMDESSAALDLDATLKLHEEVRRLRDTGICVIIVTHRIAELVRFCDQATVLREGHTVGELEKSDITEENLLALMTTSSGTSSVAASTKGATNRPLREPVLKVSNLKLKDDAAQFDFELARGEIVGVTGLDGHGQGHFIRVLAGIQSASNGSPMVADESRRFVSLTSLEDADRMGVAYVSGDRNREGIFKNLSIFENLGIGLYRRHSTAGGWIDRKPIANKFEAEVKRLKIKIGKKTDKITSLSGGNQQKVLIGRALAADPKILLLNDPARGVDISTKQELYKTLQRFTAQGGSVIYLSSEIEEFFGFANRVVVFYEGSVFRIIAESEIGEDNILSAMFGHTSVDLEYTHEDAES